MAHSVVRGIGRRAVVTLTRGIDTVWLTGALVAGALLVGAAPHAQAAGGAS
ncbi:hypothetical protein GXB81_30450, partial [Paraburkholderia sp. Ac-20336]|nr:hypothetical protein [Paraburkholderia sp. Ac-20336]